MTKQDIVKKVLAELKAKGLLNEGAIKKYVAKKKLKEAPGKYPQIQTKSTDEIGLEILNMNGGSVEGVSEKELYKQAMMLEPKFTDTQARQAVSLAFQFEANP